MAPDASAWPDLLAHGAIGAACFVVLYLVARIRWGKRGDESGSADIGLD